MKNSLKIAVFVTVLAFVSSNVVAATHSVNMERHPISQRHPGDYKNTHAKPGHEHSELNNGNSENYKSHSRGVYGNNGNHKNATKSFHNGNYSEHSGLQSFNN